MSAASGGNSEPKQGQRSQSARGFCPRSTMRVPQPDIIEHFGNADAVPQLPERCLSRKAGIVRCCLDIITFCFPLAAQKNSGAPGAPLYKLYLLLMISGFAFRLQDGVFYQLWQPHQIFLGGRVARNSSRRRAAPLSGRGVRSTLWVPNAASGSGGNVMRSTVSWFAAVSSRQPKFWAQRYTNSKPVHPLARASGV